MDSLRLIKWLLAVGVAAIITLHIATLTRSDKIMAKTEMMLVSLQKYQKKLKELQILKQQQLLDLHKPQQKEGETKKLHPFCAEDR